MYLKTKGYLLMIFRFHKIEYLNIRSGHQLAYEYNSTICIKFDINVNKISVETA